MTAWLGTATAAAILVLGLGAPDANAVLSNINVLDTTWGGLGNVATGIGPGQASPEMAATGDHYIVGGTDAGGAKVSAIDMAGHPAAAFPGGSPVTLAPASSNPSVPAIDATTVSTNAYTLGSRNIVAAAWATSTPGVVHVRILDGGPTTESQAPIASQNIDVTVGGNQPPVPMSVRFTQGGTRVLVASQVVQTDGSATSRAWSVARVAVGTISPTTAGTATLDTSYGTNGVARGPFTADGNGLQAMEVRGADGAAVLTGDGDFTGADAFPDMLHVLALDATGHPDLNFGTNGLVVLDAYDTTGGPPAPELDSFGTETGHDVALTATGDLLVGGGESGAIMGFIVRLSPTGNQRRSTFGDNGRVLSWAGDVDHPSPTPMVEEIEPFPDGSFFALGYVDGTAFDGSRYFYSSIYQFDSYGQFFMGQDFGAGDTFACVQDPRAMKLTTTDALDQLVVVGQCGTIGQEAVRFYDPSVLRRVRTTVVPDPVDVGGRSVSLDDAARPDPSSAAQSDVGGTIAASPLRSSPLRSSPLRSSPLRSSPLRSSPLRSSPLRSSPLRSSPLTEIPLRSSGGWTEVLKDTPLRSSPLQSITLGDVLDLNPPPDVSLGDLDPTQGALRRVSVASLLLLGRPLDSLPAPTSAGWCAFLEAAGPKPRCGADGVDPATTDTLDIELLGADLNDYWHGHPIPLTPDVIGTGDLRSPLGDVTLDSIDLNATQLGKVRQSDVADAVDCSSNCDQTLGDRQLADPTAFSDTTLADLLSSLRTRGQVFTLQQLLPGIMPPDELSPEESAALDDLIHRSQSNGGRMAVGLTFVVNCPDLRDGLIADFDMSGGSTYVPGSGTITANGHTYQLEEPDTSDVVHFTQLRDENGDTRSMGYVCNGFYDADHYLTVAMAFDADPPTRLGSVGDVSATVTTGSTISRPAEPVHYETADESDPPGDASTTDVLAPDRLYTGYVDTPKDVDAYRIHAPDPGSVVTVSASNLPSDLDLYVQGPQVGIPVPPSRERAATSAPLADPPLPDQSTALNGADDTPAAAGLSDSPLTPASLTSMPLRGSSTKEGTADESVSFLVQASDAGKDFLATIAGASGAASPDPYGIRVTVTPPAPQPQCIAQRTGLSGGTRGTWPSSIPSTTQTLILWDRERTDAAYPGSGAALATKLGQLAAAPGVSGVVVPVESDPAHGAAVRSAYSAWDADPCSPGAANDVVTAVGQVVDGLRPNVPQLRHVVLVGGDDLMPQARVPDLVGLGNEREEADAITAAGHDTPISRALRDGQVLTDDPYGDLDPQAWLSGTLAVPDVGLGRLVETPAEISNQIDQYIARNGVLPVSSARVTGYDFLSDGAAGIKDQLASLLGTGGDVASRIDDTWTASDALAYINRAGGGITSINGHYDHYRALPAAGGGDLLLASQAAPAPGSLLFTIGCHAGLEAIDAYDPGGANLGDWAQQLTKGGSVFAGNTGFGYGDTAGVAYSERLMDVFAAELASKQATAGQSLMYAKQRYFATLGVPGVYDGKALEEATFYGLPMYRVSTAGAVGASALPPADPSGGGTVSRTSFDVHPAFHRNDTDRGTYWTADGRDPIASHFRPLQPRTDLDVTPTDGARVHGALITTLDSTDVSGVDPVLSRPTLDLSANEPELGERDFAFPTSLQRTEEYSAADGRHTTLDLAAGQFLSDLNDPTGHGTQRLFTHIAGDVLRSASTDFDPPRIDDVGSVVTNGHVTFDVTTPDSDVASGLALYIDNTGAWHSAQLTVNGGHATGSGDLPGGAEGAGVAFVELVDRAGNVGVGTDKGRPFSLTPVPVNDGGPTIVADPAPDANGIAGGPVTITLQGFNSGTTYNLDGGLDQPYEHPITVTSPGVHTFSATDGFFGGTSRLVFIIKPSVAAPTLTRTVPASPSNNDQPKVQGSAPGAATVQLFTTADCSGTPAAQGSADAFAGDGIVVHVPHDAVTTLHATATDADGNRSLCSTDALTYMQDNTPPKTTDNYPRFGLLLGKPYTGKATDNLSGVAAVKVRFKPLMGTAKIIDATLTCTPDRRSCTWSAKLPPPLASKVTVYAVDAVGLVDPTPIERTIIL